MRRKLCVIWFAALLSFQAHANDLTALFHHADSLFRLPNPNALSDSLARAAFTTVISELESTHAQDSLLFPSYMDMGVLCDIRAKYADASHYYSGAIDCLNRHPDWSDSLKFEVFVYAGTDDYHLNNFDSAYIRLGKAEMLINRFPHLPDQGRLYNALGALFYETGNYLEGKNYFERALELTRHDHPEDKITTIDFKNNIASCLYKLGEYKDALIMYQDLIGFGQFSSEIYLNMGKAFTALHDYAHALEYYRKVKPGTLPSIFNEMGYAQFLVGRGDSALYYLNAWHTHVPAADQTRIDEGINDLYRAEVLVDKGSYPEALKDLQRSIITFSGTFTNEDFHANPENFIGSFASYRLFDALSFKADALKTVYQRSHQEAYLQAARSAYNSAIHLFRYIEKNYTTDDARLFLKNNNNQLYRNAFQVCLELNRLHPGGSFLEEAFITAEKSKASIVTGGLTDLLSDRIPGINPYFLQKERALKYNIARLEFTNNPENLSPGSQAAVQQKADYEIELALIQKNMELNSSYYKFKYEDYNPGIRELQAGLGRRQALISLFISEQGLEVFTVTATGFRHLRIDSLSALLSATRVYIDMLSNTQPGYHFGDRRVEDYLCHHLVQPLLAALPEKDEWIIIGDGIFNLLPFDALPADADRHLLIENVAVSYQLSTKFMAGPYQDASDKFAKYSVLSFAPFAEHDEWVSTPTPRLLDQLPESGSEVAGWTGISFLNEHATKARFLQEANRFPVIELATHAIRDSSGAFIAFYPQGKGPEEDCLSLAELYGLKLDSTALVILSTCESGKGAIVENEGVISLSRGFMYAGCSSTVGSLWRADDRSTEAILRGFQEYLQRGYSKTEALRKAKLDYIHSNALHVTPNYWAHLILVGNTSEIVGKTFWWLYLALGLFACLAVYLVFRIRKSRLFMR